MKNKIIYLLILGLLLVGYFSMETRTLDQDTLALIEETRSKDKSYLWPGFNPDTYPVDVNYGKVEYRYDEGSISQQKPYLPKALSAVMEEGRPVIKVISLEDFRKGFDFGDLPRDQAGKVYQTVLIHEAFHCYQYEKGAPAIHFEKLEEMKKTGEGEDYQAFTELLARIDDDKTYQDLWLREAQALENIQPQGKLDDWIQAKALKEDYERTFLGKDQPFFHKFASRQELLEGTARYVEDKMKADLGMDLEDPWTRSYISGVEKYYRSGALKSSILDERFPDWKENISFQESAGLDELLESTK